MENLINTTVRLKEDAAWAGTAASSGWPNMYGTVVDETDTKARIRWGNGTLSWEQKRDLYVLA